MSQVGHIISTTVLILYRVTVSITLRNISEIGATIDGRFYG